MSSNSLLLSLLPNCSNNFRSSSLTSKNPISPFLSFYPRSTSTDHGAIKQKPAFQSNEKKWTPLLKMGHLLNVKIKKGYYFVFCKLQHFTKDQEKVTSMTRQDSKEESVDNSSILNRQSESRAFLVYKQRMAKAIGILDGTCSTLKTKIQIRQEKQVYGVFFRAIKRLAMIQKGIFKLKKCTSGMKVKRYLYFVRLVQKYENQKMRTQILVMSLERLYKNGLATAMKGLKEWKELRVKLLIEKSFVSAVNHEVAKTPRSYYNNKTVNLSQKSKTQMANVSQQDAGQANLMSVRAARAKKIVLREKKLSTVEPMSIPISKFTKALKIGFKEDCPMDRAVFEGSSGLMSRPKNEKHQVFVHCLPDLIDNCNIFRELPLHEEAFQPQPVVRYDNCLTEVRNSAYLNTLQDCRTERHKQRQRQKTTYREQAPLCARHVSPGTTLGKKMRGYEEQVGQNSPLVKIDRILSKIQQMKGPGNEETLERAKKTVNVNIPRNIYETARKGQTRNAMETIRTPLKENNSYEMDRYRSSLQRKGTERLVTEKNKESSNQKCSNFQLHSASKSNKSAMLSKAKKQKQMCTAGKMKMEIENLISRRNKELSRNDPQLK